MVMLDWPLTAVHEYVPPAGFTIAESVMLLLPTAPAFNIAILAGPEIETVGTTLTGALALFC
jgi:hypothetical protein